VTQADRASEQVIVSMLRQAFPDHSIRAEEGSDSGSSDGPIWFVDPLDGTTNFAHGFPVFAVSMALLDEAGLAVGIVYDPLRDECFSAIRGGGAALNGAPIRVSTCPDIDHALLATGFPYDRRTVADNNTTAFGVLIRRCQGIRRAGAAALDLAYVACGRLDGYWEMRLQPWDVAAGMLIVREAGGIVTDYQGNAGQPATILSQQIVASNGQFHAEILSSLREVYPLQEQP
jgi:myo-inositol-1(or 4)-monophosphatase